MWIGGVRVVIFDEDMKLLMVRQHHEGRDIWMVPGGAIEEGETARIAAVREVREETGLEIEVGRMIWHIEEVNEKRGQRFVNYFGAEIIGGHAALGKDPEFDDEHQVLRELKFMSREEIRSLSEKVYPSSLKDEIWKLADGDLKDYDSFQIRE